MTDTPKKRARIAQRFTDHGTGERFMPGAIHLLEAGAYANYEAAGLIAAAPPAAKAPAKPPSKAKPASKPKKPKPAPTPAPAAPALEQPAEPPDGDDLQASD